MNTTVIAAINNHNLLSFFYRGYPRTVEPHTYGLTKNGDERLRAYQTSGQSESGKVPDWKIFKIEEMENVELLSGKFGEPEQGYTKGDPLMKTIYAEL